MTTANLGPVSDAGLPQGVLDLLEQPLDPHLVARRRGSQGRMVPYLEGHQVINQANRIFGYGNWGAEVVGPVRYRELSRLNTKTGELAPIGMYWAAVRVTVAGCPPRSDVGCGFAEDTTPEAHDTALKGAITDALKRGLRGFGPQFGNALYQERGSAAAPEAKELGELRAAVLALGTRLGLTPSATRERVEQRLGHPIDRASSAELARLLRVMAEAPRRDRSRPAA